MSGLAYGISTLFGGWLFDYIGREPFSLGPLTFDVFSAFFAVGWIGRLLGLAPIALAARAGSVELARDRAALAKRGEPVAAAQA